MPYVGALWFLTAFFIANILYYIINTIKSPYIQLLTVLLTVSLGTLFPLILPFRLPYTLDSGLVGVGFMYGGHKLKISPYYDKLTHLPCSTLLIASIVLLGTIFLNGHVNMRRGIYQNVLLFWVNALGCILIGINLCKRIANMSSKSRIVTRSLAWVAVMGRDSLIFLCVNEAVITVLKHIITLHNKLLAHIICLILTVMVCYTINYVVQHTKLRLFLGKL